MAKPTTIDLFNKSIVTKLEEKLNESVIKVREQAGIKLSYVEGWYIQDELNKVFGFGNWDQEIVALDEVVPLMEIKRGDKTMYKIVYRCVMRLSITPAYTRTVSEDDGDEDGTCLEIRTRDVVIREDVGTGSGTSSDPAVAVDTAIKEAATDALKRAAKSLGYRFGLALYDKEQANVKSLEEQKSEEWMNAEQAKLKDYAAKNDSMQIAAWSATYKEKLQAKAKAQPNLKAKIDETLNVLQDVMAKVKIEESTVKTDV